MSDPQPSYNRQRLFAASCVALVTTAMYFSIRTDVLDALGKEFNVGQEQQGLINLFSTWGFPIAMLIGGPLCDAIGMGRLLRLACVGHIGGVLLTIASPHLGGFGMLLAASVVTGLANGFVEAVINPLAATMYPEDKSHRLNVLHAWWPGGLVIGGLLAAGLGYLFEWNWQAKMATILAGAVVYGIMLTGQRFPPTERVAAGIPGAEMVREAFKPGLFLLLACMCLTAVTELGPDQWVGSVLTDTVGIRGVLFLVYTSGLMFVLRFFAGPLLKRLSPFGLLWAAALFSAAGLYWLSGAFTAGSAFAAATVFGLGKAYFWPTMLGVAAERYPRGGSLVLAMMGAAGSIAAGLAGPVMGGIYERGTVAALPPGVSASVVADGRYRPKDAEVILKAAAAPGAPPQTVADAESIRAALRSGASGTFRAVSLLPVVLLVVFGAMFLYYRSIGGYRTVRIGESPPES